MSSGAETSLAIVRGAIANSQRLTRSLPAHSAYGLPVYGAASQAAPFLGFARNDKAVVAAPAGCGTSAILSAKAASIFPSVGAVHRTAQMIEAIAYQPFPSDVLPIILRTSKALASRQADKS